MSDKAELQQKLDELDLQEKRIISAIFEAAHRENITLGRLCNILENARATANELMSNTLVPEYLDKEKRTG